MIAIGLLFSAFCHIFYGSVDAAISRLRGDFITIQNQPVELPASTSGQIEQGFVEVTNDSSEPIRLLSGSVDCTCTSLVDLPVVIEGGQSKKIRFKVIYPAAPGFFLHRGAFLTDSEAQQLVNFDFRGRVVAK